MVLICFGPEIATNQALTSLRMFQVIAYEPIKQYTLSTYLGLNETTWQIFSHSQKEPNLFCYTMWFQMIIPQQKGLGYSLIIKCIPQVIRKSKWLYS